MENKINEITRHLSKIAKSWMLFLIIGDRLLGESAQMIDESMILSFFFSPERIPGYQSTLPTRKQK
jgi:hypothetical protein